MSDDPLVDAISRAIDFPLQWENRGDLAQTIRDEIDRKIVDVLATMLRHSHSSGETNER
jgi:hypothetical protein